MSKKLRTKTPRTERVCLNCPKTFLSTGIENRVCCVCKKTRVWQSAENPQESWPMPAKSRGGIR